MLIYNSSKHLQRFRECGEDFCNENNLHPFLFITPTDTGIFTHIVIKFGWQNRKQRPNRSTNIRDMADKAKHPVSEGVSVCDIYLITQKVSFEKQNTDDLGES